MGTQVTHLLTHRWRWAQAWLAAGSSGGPRSAQTRTTTGRPEPAWRFAMDDRRLRTNQPPTATTNSRRHSGATEPAAIPTAGASTNANRVENEPPDPPRYVSPLSTSAVEYTAEEIHLIEASKSRNAEGSKRTIVCDNAGRQYTVAGLNRFPGDFTMPSGIEVHAVSTSPHWIRAPAPGEATEFTGGWFVRETRRMHLVHSNARPIRHADTIGMFPGGMTIVFDSRTLEEIREEAASQQEANPGILDELTDDILPGDSPR